jgi:hypothetical protein
VAAYLAYLQPSVVLELSDDLSHRHIAKLLTGCISDLGGPHMALRAGVLGQGDLYANGYDFVGSARRWR